MLRTAALTAVLALAAQVRTVQDVSPPPVEGDRVDVFEMDVDTLRSFVWETPENATLAYGQVRARLEEIPFPERVRIAEAARVVTETCPYNGVTVELVATLAKELDALTEVAAVNETLRAEVASLRDALASVHALNETLLVAPLRTLSVEEVEARLATVRERVDGLSAAETARIELNRPIVSGATLELWNDKGPLIRAANRLQELAVLAHRIAAATDDPRVDEGAKRVAEGAERLARALWGHVGLYC